MTRTEDFQDLMGQLEYSMLVVTAFDGRRRAGCLVGFATQCSIDPPRYLVCVSKANHTHAVAAGSDVLVVHAPGADQMELARHFGEATGDVVDKFSGDAGAAWRAGPGGAPILDGCAWWFAGRVLDRIDAGDHTGFRLEPIEVAVSRAPGPGLRPLLFSAVKDFHPGHRAD